MGATGKVIAIGNLKGGVGKSTLAVNLASALGARGLGTVLFDTDPQQTAAAWGHGRRLPCAVRPSPIRELNAVGGWLGELAGAKAAHARIVIDLPATLSPALAAAFLAADVILIPTSFSPVDLAATRRTVRHAKVAAGERPARPPLVAAVPMLARRNWLGRPRPPAPHRRVTDVATTPAVGYDAAFGESFERKDWIGGHAPQSRAHFELMAVVDLIEAGLANGGLEPVNPPVEAERGGGRVPDFAQLLSADPDVAPPRSPPQPPPARAKQQPAPMGSRRRQLLGARTA